MAAAIPSEKIDLLIYGPHKPIVDNGFSDQFVWMLTPVTRLSRAGPRKPGQSPGWSDNGFTANSDCEPSRFRAARRPAESSAPA